MRRLLHLLTSLALTLTALTYATSTAHAFTDRDCSDFATQAAAQDFYDANGGSADPHRLDADGDGVACDSNPCPCSTGGGTSTGETTGTTGGGTSKDKGSVVRENARVIKVVDGDTVDVRLTSGSKERVRILGIDTPEVYGGTECYGPEASAKTKQLLPPGTRVLLTSDPSQDRTDAYGRLLRYITKGKKDIGKTLVRTGHAEVYVYGGNPFNRTKPYRAAENKAKAHARGLWGAC